MRSSQPKHTRKRKHLALPIVFAVTLAATVSGCAKSYVVTADELCRSWRHQTVSKDDKLTQETAAQIQGNNDARPTWGCVRGENKSKG